MTEIERTFIESRPSAENPILDWYRAADGTLFAELSPNWRPRNVA